MNADFKINFSNFFIIFIGCATGSYIITGTIRPAIDPSQVKIYIIPLPSEYETIGIVEASSEVEFSTQAAQDRAINELKSQAVKIGANGIILGNIGTNVSGSVGIYSNGVFIPTDSETKNCSGASNIYNSRIKWLDKM